MMNLAIIFTACLLLTGYADAFADHLYFLVLQTENDTEAEAENVDCIILGTNGSSPAYRFSGKLPRGKKRALEVEIPSRLGDPKEVRLFLNSAQKNDTWGLGQGLLIRKDDGETWSFDCHVAEHLSSCQVKNMETVTLRLLNNCGRAGILQNLALNRSAFQSSSWHNTDYPASTCFDGVRPNGNVHSPSCCHTERAPGSWLAADFGVTQNVGAVVLVTRPDWNLPYDFELSVGQIFSTTNGILDGELCYKQKPRIDLGAGVFVCEKPLSGRYVMFKQLQNEYLNICEMEVYESKFFTVSPVLIWNHMIGDVTQSLVRLDRRPSKCIRVKAAWFAASARGFPMLYLVMYRHWNIPATGDVMEVDVKHGGFPAGSGHQMALAIKVRQTECGLFQGKFSKCATVNQTFTNVKFSCHCPNVDACSEIYIAAEEDFDLCDIPVFWP